MSKYINSGTHFSVMSDAVILDALPLGVYSVGFDPNRGFFLEAIENFTVPTKLYGNTIELVTRVMNTFKARMLVNTGILLTGEKGSGKTMTTRALSRAMKNEGMSTIIINQQFAGEEFNKFMSLINQPCLVIFDEFEKVYDDEHQMLILTLLDGLFTSRKLFAFTVNSAYKVNTHMLNRPGRLFYNVKFRGIDNDAIDQYCADNLQDLSMLSSIHDVSATIDAFNFDMLQSLVEEMNRFGEDAKSAVKFMNIRPEGAEYVAYEGFAVRHRDNKRFKIVHYNGANPLATNKQISFHIEADSISKEKAADLELAAMHGEDVDDGEMLHVVLTLRDFSHQDVRVGDIVFKRDGYEFTFQKISYSEFAF